MAFAKKFWIGSASGIALICAASPVWADAPAQDPTAVDEVVVTGIRQSLEKAIQVKRESDNQVDAISATDIGKLPDKNVADALQRLPGVNTSSAASGEGGFDENDRVSIRGTSPSLTQVVIDGHAVATGDWFILDQFQTVGRSVSFDLLPSEVVQGVSVYKTQDASLLEGGVAGLIDIQTRDPLRFASKITMEGSVQGAYNTLSKHTRPQINALLGWKNEAGTLGIVVQGFHEERSVRRYGQETLGYTTITTGMATGAAIPALVGVSAPTLIGSSLFEQEKKRDGGFAAVTFEPNDTWSFNLSGFYSKLNASNTNSNYMYWGSRLLQSSVPTAYTVVNNTLVAATFPAGGPGQEGLVVDNIVRPDASGKSYYLNLDTTWKFSDKLTFKGQIGYTEGVGDTPTEPAYEVMGGTAGISYARSGNGWVVTPAAGNGYVNPQSPAGLANDWAWNETFTSTDKEFYGKIDGVWDVDVGAINKVMFGLRAAKHTRQVDGWDRGCTIGTNGQCFSGGGQAYSATSPTSYPGGFNGGALGIPGLLIPIQGDPNKIIAILDGLTDPLRGPISHIVQPANYYWPGAFKVEEEDYEGYAMAKVGGDHWRGNFGLRLVGTRETPHANISDPGAIPGTPAAIAKGDIFTSAYGPYYVTNETHNYFDVLPSVNLTFDLADNVLLRVSAAETMSRPDFSALGGTVSLSDTSLTGSGGNPNLRPIKSSSFDFALEYYYGPASVAAISLFYDDLSSYVSYSTSDQVYYSLFYNAFKTYNVSSPVNASGKVQGIELQVQQPIAYGFGFQANATYADGHENSGAPLVGTSRYTYNLVGYYEGHGLSVRAAYTYRSHYFVGLDRSSAENQENYGTLDASINYQLTPNISINIDALNLTDNLLKYYGANKTQPRAVYENGTQVFAGIRFRF